MFETAAGDVRTHVDTTTTEEMHLLDLLTILAAHKKLVIALPLLGAAAALTASLVMAPTFTSTAKVMPPQQQNSGMTAMLGQLGGLAGAAGGLAGLKNPADLYVGLLESRTVADSLIARFKLKARYEKRTMDDTRRELAGLTAVVNSKKDGLISITVNDEDPQFAADLANAYFDELIRLTQTMAITEASQRRIFFEKQLKSAKDQLADAEVRLRTTQETTGLIQPLAQVEAIITSVAQLKGTIVAKEVALEAMRSFATERNPELVRLQEELRGLRAQLSKLEKSQPSKQDGDFMVPTGRIPEAGVEYVRAMRDVKYYETIFELLAKQFEMAKIDEAKEPTQVQMLDRAVPADRKLKPKPVLMTLAGLIGGGLLGILLAFSSAAYRSSSANPATRQRWERLSLAWRNKR
jgi:tyrosine-protein kinase Etk/Wzc